MNILDFEIKTENKSGSYNRFILEPLTQGYAHTLGTALRRVLLTGIPGAAITQVKIAGLKHQFSPLKGVRQDGVELLLNLKKVRISYFGEKQVKLVLAAKGRGEVCAGDIKETGGVKIANPDLVIANLADKDSKLDIDLYIDAGMGYSPSEERKTATVGLIPLDADFSPVTKVNYKVEQTRVGRLTNYDKLTLEVWTDGSVTAQEAVKKASEILVAHFSQIATPARKKKTGKKEKEVNMESADHRLSVEEVGLPTRIANALMGAKYETVGDLKKAGREKLSRIRNLGEKSVTIIEKALEEKGISL